MIVRHDLFEIERIEQLLLIPYAPSHHRTTPPMFASKRRNHCSATASIDFCNKIGQKPTSLRRSSRQLGAANFNDVIYFAGSWILARSVPTTVMPVNPLS